MPFAGGSGTSSDPYQIENWNHLASARNNLDSFFVLNNDLDSNTTGYSGEGDSFAPIGDRATTDFTGDFDGQNNVIRDIVIEGSNDGCGLFGSYYPSQGSNDAQSVSIRNLGVKGSSTQTGAGRYTALLAGIHAGKIKNCYVDGVVDSPNNDTGGISGSNTLGNDSRTLIENCYVFGSISGAEKVGGILGTNQVQAAENCYNFASVSGSAEVGGAVGRNNSGSLINCYSTGTVSASSGSEGGLTTDDFSNGSATDCYWDTEASGISTSSQGTGLTTSEMIGSAASTNMSGFDFTNDWDTVVASSSQNIREDSYPVLLSQSEDEQLSLRGVYTYIGSVSFDIDANVASNVFFDVKSTAGYSIELNGTEVYSQSGGTGGSLVTRSADLSSYSGATTVNIVVLSPGSEYFEFGNVRTDEVI